MVQGLWRKVVPALVCIVFAGVGCSMRSPVLLYRGTKESGATTLLVPFFSEDRPIRKEPILPLKAGVRVSAARERKVCSLFTYLFPWYFISAGFPKRDEMEFLRDSIVRDLFDTRTFRYTYPAPFDPAAVDVIVNATVTEVRASNLKVYPTIIGLPYISLLTLVGVPQEIFFARMGFRFDVTTPDGTVLKTYEVFNKGTDAVTIYEQPWANYIWYRSVFRSTFLASMDEFREQLRSDAPFILERLKQARR